MSTSTSRRAERPGASRSVAQVCPKRPAIAWPTARGRGGTLLSHARPPCRPPWCCGGPSHRRRRLALEPDGAPGYARALMPPQTASSPGGAEDVLAPGQVVGGRFQIESEVGRDALGAVLRAKDQ